MIGINGVVTFKNAHLDERIQDFPLDRILLETDAPYLSPVPYRGKRNLPVYIWKTAEKLGNIWNLPTEQIVEATQKNAIRQFKLAQFDR